MKRIVRRILPCNSEPRLTEVSSRRAYNLGVRLLVIRQNATAAVSVTALIGTYQHPHKRRRSCVFPERGAYLFVTLLYGTVFGSYKRRRRKCQVLCRYLRIFLRVAGTLLAIGEQRYGAPHADVRSMRQTSRILVSGLQKFPSVSPGFLYSVVREIILLLRLLWKVQRQEGKLFVLRVNIRVNIKIPHVGILAQAAVVYDLL